MIEPKEFYRKLDFLLSKINIVKTDTDFLFTIVKELETTFGADLKIGGGRIYERTNDEFILLSPAYPGIDKSEGIKLNMNSLTVQSVLKSKTFIYDSPDSGLELKNVNSSNYYVPVAIIVHNKDHNWIILFELGNGWIREEIEFCLNAVRATLNYRLIAESIKSEYEQAFLIQKSLLPTSSPDITGYQIAGNSQQADLVGGDLFDYYKFNDDEFGFCVGDASGHGMPAALMARDVIVGLRMGLENQMKMGFTLKKLNRVIYQSGYSSRFISLFYAEIEKDGNMFYVNAGHPSPIIVHQNNVNELESTGIVFGALEEVDLVRSYLKIQPDTVLVFYTDGIIERINSDGEEFGEELLKQVILKHKDLSASEILNKIFETVNAFGNKKRWKDDATVVVIKRII